MNALAWRLARFGAVGLLGSIVQVAAVAALSSLGMTAVAATPIAVEIAVIHNLIWHQRFTWRERQGDFLRRSLRFHATTGMISIAGNTLLVYLLTPFLAAVPASIAAIASCGGVNFLVADRWVWRTQRAASDSDRLQP